MLEDKQQNQTDNKSEQINTEENTLRESYFQEADAKLSDSYCALSKKNRFYLGSGSKNNPCIDYLFQEPSFY